MKHFRLAAAKLPFPDHLCNTAGDVMKANDLRGMSQEDLNKELLNLRREQFSVSACSGRRGNWHVHMSTAGSIRTSHE